MTPQDTLAWFRAADPKVTARATEERRVLAFDIETNGLLDQLTRVHSLVLRDLHTGEVWSCTDNDPKDHSVPFGVKMLMEARRVVGHNIIKFDIPALAKVYPWFNLDGVEVEDTLVESRLIWSDLTPGDQERIRKGTFPGRLIGAHGLEAWGYRLGKMKGDYSELREAEAKEQGITDRAAITEFVWATWNPPMQDYCIQDVEVTAALWDLIHSKRVSRMAVEMEHRFADIIAGMERNGFSFNEAGAQALYATLVGKRLEIGAKLRAVFPPKEVTETFIPKVNSKRFGYEKGVPFTKRWMVEFNPSSRQMIGDRLIALGWSPSEYTPSGQPKIDEKILSKLPWPEAAVLAEHFLIEKRIGQIAEGDQAWLRLVRKGRIHGSVNTNGAVTGRCTHSNPNVAQVPKCGSPYGHECRDLFSARKGWRLVGIDLAGVELRCLAHYMSRYDGGAYGRAVVEGKEANGDDVHSLNCIAMGLDPKAIYVAEGKTQTGRNLAKTFIYAFLYGAGDEKLGTIVGVSPEEIAAFPRTEARLYAAAIKRFERDGRELDPVALARVVKGGILKASFLKKTPALAMLREAVSLRADGWVQKQKPERVTNPKDWKQALDKSWWCRCGIKGELTALDGRTLSVRHSHAALNTLLQNAGALVAKLATILAYDSLQSAGHTHGRDWALCAHIHDELQIESKEGIVDAVKHIVIVSMQEAGRILGFRVPIDGAAKDGFTWADTH
jgi:DNA polymerase I-like protein with 3'-5' exonuclease and polymerase domains